MKNRLCRISGAFVALLLFAFPHFAQAPSNVSSIADLPTIFDEFTATDAWQLVNPAKKPGGAVVRNGELEIVAECEESDARNRYFLKSGSERVELNFVRKPSAALTTGQRLQVHGTLKAGRLSVDEEPVIIGSATTDSAVAPDSVAATGERKVLILLVNFQNNATQPFTTAQANNLVFNTANTASVTNYYREASYGKTWVTGDTYGWFTLPMNADCNAIGTIATNAKQAAANAGVNVANYANVMYVFPSIGCSYTGTSVVGGTDAWINGSLTLRTVAHELGHNLGLFHAAALDCGVDVVGATCSTISYGNQVDMLGYPGVTGHFHAFQKERLGWLNIAGSPSVLTITGSGTYQISPNSVQDVGYKALRILKSTDAAGVKTWYYVEFRQPVGFDGFIAGNSSFMNGVILTLNTESDGTKNYQLDMTPATTSWTDSSLLAGKTFTDSGAGFSITTVSTGSSGATVNVTLGAPPPPPPPTSCTPVNPTVTASPTATQTVGAGSAVTYSVSITNNNGSTCTANAFNTQAALPSGWLSTPASVTVAPGATATATVQVTAPATTVGGSYAISVGAVNSANGSVGAFVPASLYIVSSVGVTAAPSQSTYTSAQTVSVTAAVKANGVAIGGIGTSYTINRPDGSVAATGTVVSGSNGNSLITYKFNKRRDSVGTYRVVVTAGIGSISATTTTQFVLN